MFSGLKTQEDWSGMPEQERVTNMGAVSPELFSGVMEAVTFPDCPRPRDKRGRMTEIWKSGVVTVWAWMVAAEDADEAWVASPT